MSLDKRDKQYTWTVVILAMLALLIFAVNLRNEQRYQQLDDKLTFINDNSLMTINEGLGDINDNIVSSDENSQARYADLLKVCGE